MLQFTIVLLLCVCFVSTQDLTSDDEDFTTGGILDAFLTQLELLSGLSSIEPDSIVTGLSCPGYTQCKINPNGTVLWDLRSNLYKSFMMQSTEDETEQMTTIDGCLKYNPTDRTAYNDCMRTVRLNMRIELVISFIYNFKELIEDDCSLIDENCVV